MTFTVDRLRRIAIVGIGNVVGVLILLELAGLFGYYVSHNEFYYVRERPLSLAGVATSADVTASKHVLHPFFGYIYRPSLPMSRVTNGDGLKRLLYGSATTPEWTNLRANNLGFFSPYDYPYSKADSNQYIIGVFGGSVAHYFSLQGAVRLCERLGQLPLFQDKDIVVLNFAQGGFKQPQQLQMLSYFLAVGQQFDFIVHINGFNEIALSHLNHRRGISTAMPSAQHYVRVINLLSAGEVELPHIADAYMLYAAQRRMRRLEERLVGTQSAGMYLALSLLHRITQKKYNRMQTTLDSLSSGSDGTDLVHVSELPTDYSPSRSLTSILSLWLNASLTMQRLSDANGIPYLEIVQPNQYFSAKQFSKEEQGIAISDRSPFREGIEQGYRQLADHVRQAHEMGVNVVSAVDIFDAIQEPVYADNCCHYNQIGNEILAEYVATLMAALLGERDGPAATSGAGQNGSHPTNRF